MCGCWLCLGTPAEGTCRPAGETMDGARMTPPFGAGPLVFRAPLAQVPRFSPLFLELGTPFPTAPRGPLL